MHLRLEHLLVSCTLSALFHCVATKQVCGYLHDIQSASSTVSLQVCPPPRVSPENPNVIILMVDDLGKAYFLRFFFLLGFFIKSVWKSTRMSEY